MKCIVRAFGITKDIVGGKELSVELTDSATVKQLKDHLESSYPRMTTLRSLFIAVNGQYAENDHVLHESDEIALIPPVSGG